MKKKNLLKLQNKISRVRIKNIGIAKCNPFPHYHDTKKISFYYFRDTKVCAKHEKTHVTSI